jgi:ArsR family transcriptional regulator
MSNQSYSQEHLMVAIHEAQAEFLQAVGQATRLRILEVLADGELCVCDIQAAVGEQQSNVSKHLAILRRAGILTARREGGRVIYRIRDGRIPEALRRLSDVAPRDFFGSEP